MSERNSPAPDMPNQSIEGRMLEEADKGKVVEWSKDGVVDVGTLIGWSDKRVYVDFGPGKGVAFVSPDTLKWK